MVILGTPSDSISDGNLYLCTRINIYWACMIEVKSVSAIASTGGRYMKLYEEWHKENVRHPAPSESEDQAGSGLQQPCGSGVLSEDAGDSGLGQFCTRSYIPCVSGAS